MSQYHVKKDGTPGICNAQKGRCPLGQLTEHFPTKEEAQEYADKLNEKWSERRANRKFQNKQFKNYFTLEERLKLRNYLETGDKSSITEKDINRLRDLMHNGNEIISNLEYTEYEYDRQPKELFDPEFEHIKAVENDWLYNNKYDEKVYEKSDREYQKSESGRRYLNDPENNLMFRELDDIKELKDYNKIRFVTDEDLHKLRVLIGDEEPKLFGKFKNIFK